MRNYIKVTVYLLFSLVYAAVFSLGVTCLLNLMGIAFAISLDGYSSQYPRFIPFCLIVGFLALASLIFLAVLNIKYSEKLRYTKTSWIGQSVFAFVISLPTIALWQKLFELLQKIF